MEFYATCPVGFERALAGELSSLKLPRVRRLKGRVSFEGEPADAYRACLWSRLASRVFLVLGRAQAETADQLYAAALSLPWETIVAPGATLAVSARGTTKALRNTHFTELRVKDAVCDRLEQRRGQRPNVDPRHAGARVAVSLSGGKASFSFDFSGEPLFHRLPRAARAAAPVLRSDYAALMLDAAGWYRACRANDPVLVDLSCAGGGVAVEAASMALDRAPGAARARWGFQSWEGYDADTWFGLLSEADERAEKAAGKQVRVIVADTDASLARAAQRLANAAGVGRCVSAVEASPQAVLAALDALDEKSGSLSARTAAKHPQNRRRMEQAAARNVAAHASDRRGLVVADLRHVAPARLPLALSVATAARNAPACAGFPLAALAYDDVLGRALGAVPANEVALKPQQEDAVLYVYPAPRDVAAAVREGEVAEAAGEPVRGAAVGATRGAEQLGAAPTGAVAHAQRGASASTGVSAGASAAGRAEGPADGAATPAWARTAAAADAAVPGSAPADVGAADKGPAPANAADRAPGAPAAKARGRRGSGASASRPQGQTVLDLGEKGSVPVLVAQSDQFAARLKKVAKQRRKWARRAGVTCYRVYDADLPDYACAIDLYEGAPATPGRWLVIAEYQAPKTVDPALAEARLLDMVAIAPALLDVPVEHVAVKARRRAKGGSQYAGAAGAGRAAHGSQASGRAGRGAHPAAAPVLVEEGGLTFEVNFDDYLDTGLFLDHRVTRGLVREDAYDVHRFLNLFAYTGTATCYAADGGAKETTTVDLSNTYLAWARRNMERNGFSGPEHEFVRADVVSWINEQRHTRNRWNLIFCDPPTFSNSNAMGRRSFDVQRDHVDLLIGVSRLLTVDGQAIFSCNLRTFKPDLEALARAGVILTDITAQTIPEDFARNPRIHRCYRLRRTTPAVAQRQLAEQAR